MRLPNAAWRVKTRPPIRPISPTRSTGRLTLLLRASPCGERARPCGREARARAEGGSRPAMIEVRIRSTKSDMPREAMRLPNDAWRVKTRPPIQPTWSRSTSRLTLLQKSSSCTDCARLGGLRETRRSPARFFWFTTARPLSPALLQPSPSGVSSFGPAPTR